MTLPFAHNGMLDALPIKARLFGPFSLRAPDGRDLAPASTKAQAALAMLLIADDQKRARAVLAETLWSDRARPQALGSLRQALAEIRRGLGDYAGMLIVDRKWVHIRQGTVETDLASAAEHIERGRIFLEGVEPADPAFQRWKETAAQGFGLSARKQNAPILHINTTGNASPYVRRMMSHGIVDSIADWCAAQIATSSDNGRQFGGAEANEVSEFLLETHLHEFKTKDTNAHLALFNRLTGRSEWAMGSAVCGVEKDPMDDSRALHFINAAVDRSIQTIAPPGAETMTARYLSAGVLGSVRLIFRNEPGDINAAFKQLQLNFDLHPQGIYLAWSAYVLTLRHAETSAPDRQALFDQAEDYARRAVELDPFGAMTLALCSYVQSFILGQTELGYELANRSIAVNRANPLAWVFRGAANFFRGDGEAARRDTEFAQAIAADGPYRYVIDTFCCVASTVAGRFDEAVVYGEAAARQAPRYRAPLRYLAAIHATRSNHTALRAVVEKLRKIEPNFAIESLEHTAYPVPALRAAGLTKAHLGRFR